MSDDLKSHQFYDIGLDGFDRRQRGQPAFIVIDDKGNDFFKELNLG